MFGHGLITVGSAASFLDEWLGCVCGRVGPHLAFLGGGNTGVNRHVVFIVMNLYLRLVSGGYILSFIDFADGTGEATEFALNVLGIPHHAAAGVAANEAEAVIAVGGSLQALCQR